ncbi:hypothetical protein NHX12_012142 [Muraenolepis orangiensis]|uniref:Rab-GAP TBC domain-containing protein n=1 Tax=Muraenolepis orangiensis TaxID=630683 RepID=A0A9Q0I7W5_9TELE|nr:hypothetical protein NHX12_012142 [Muraenolepis orangiensis]
MDFLKNPQLTSWLRCGSQYDIIAYKMQNMFLNSEIYQLTKLWRMGSEQEKSLMVKRGTVNRLIEDALQGDPGTGGKMTARRRRSTSAGPLVPVSRRSLKNLLRVGVSREYRQWDRCSLSPAHQKLQGIPLAFSWQNPTIGYCQGLNLLVAISLLVLQDEEEAIWCLVAIMPQDYYTKNMVASQEAESIAQCTGTPAGGTAGAGGAAAFGDVFESVVVQKDLNAMVSENLKML